MAAAATTNARLRSPATHFVYSWSLVNGESSTASRGRGWRAGRSAAAQIRPESNAAPVNGGTCEYSDGSRRAGDALTSRRPQSLSTVWLRRGLRAVVGQQPVVSITCSDES